MSTTDATERFREKVERGDDDECWEWTGSTSRGYGKFHYDGRNRQAHRVALLLRDVDIDGEQVNHHCDNRSCVNPAHLYVGDQSENIEDAYSRNRRTSTGESNPNAKLDAGDVRDIRDRSDEEYQKLADEYEVSVSLIEKVVSRRVWGDLDE